MDGAVTMNVVTKGDVGQPARDVLADAALDQLFRKAHTHYAWLDKPVPETVLRELYDLAKWGPTTANSGPTRFVFVTSEAGKARLLPAMSDGNKDKTRTAPVNVIVAWDTEFYEQLPKLMPHADARSWFAGKPAAIEHVGKLNVGLQGAYMMLAARSLGLDCGPMGGFDAEAINREFFADGKYKVAFVCNLGYGDESKAFPRNPRLDFDEACQVL